MGSAGKQAKIAPKARETEVLEAALRVYRHPELPAQLMELTRTLHDWVQPEATFAFGPALEGNGWAVLASSLDENDPRTALIRPIAPGHYKSLLPTEVEVADGFGRMAEIFDAWADSPTCSIVVPLVSKGSHGDGLIVMLGKSKPAEPVLQRVRDLIDESRGALRHARQVATMQQLIIKDDTAHCFNRRYFEEFLPEELARASRFRAPLSLIFLDMDGLKAINTEFGHARGSRSLLEVSLRIRGKIRKFDKLFRFGGDEFCIVLPETEWHGAVEVAERVRDAIETQPFLARELNSDGVRMTASLGIAAYPLHARNKKDLVQLADRAMQKIKRTTKNGVAVAEIHGEENGQ